MASVSQPIQNRIPQGVKFIPEESTDLKSVIEKVTKIQREQAARTLLTWDPKHLPVSGEAKMVGDELCLSLPYVLVDRRYYIQNVRIYRTNGEETSLDEISEEDGTGLLYMHVKEAYENHKAEAVKADANLCQWCFLFSAKTQKDYLKHMVEVHPDVVTKVAQGEKVLDEPPLPRCLECHREFDTMPRMEYHMLRKHGVQRQYRPEEKPEKKVDSAEAPVEL
jgi:hypothetical protein